MFNQDFTSKNRALSIKHKWIRDCLMSFVCGCVSVYVCALWVFPLSGSVLFLSKVTPVTMAATSALWISPSFSSYPLSFSFFPYTPVFLSPSFSLSFSLSHPSLSSLSAASITHHSKQATTAFIYMAHLVLGQALSSLAARYMEIMEMLLISAQCYPAIPP